MQSGRGRWIASVALVGLSVMVGCAGKDRMPRGGGATYLGKSQTLEVADVANLPNPSGRSLMPPRDAAICSIQPCAATLPTRILGPHTGKRPFHLAFESQPSGARSGRQGRGSTAGHGDDLRSGIGRGESANRRGGGAERLRCAVWRVGLLGAR